MAEKVTAADRAVIDQMQAYWTNFAKTGDPNGNGLPQWGPTSASAPKNLVVGDDGTKTVDGFRAHQLAIIYAGWSQRTGVPAPN